jgi:SpoIID/LytB domain protein
MITSEPSIRVGLVDRCKEVSGEFLEIFTVNRREAAREEFRVTTEGGTLVMRDARGRVLASGHEIGCIAERGGRFMLRNVTIGIHFHWERNEDQIFEGGLRFLMREEGTIAVLNDILLEDYLKSVISSEMSGEAPLEFLKAHAITSRSWLVAMLERAKRTGQSQRPQGGTDGPAEIIRWYTREDHDVYDVCADDHCQRYQGLTKIISTVASEAIASTRGQFLLYDGEVCDARFYKACGGITEEFQNAWEDTPIPYLSSITDAPLRHEPIKTEADANAWIHSQPEAYCNTKNSVLLKQILPSFDQETTDFFRWTVRYRREELEQLLREKSGYDFGTIRDLIPLGRGPSGRIIRLEIVGSKRTLVVGKELEIRRWLSPSHLYSSAFVLEFERDQAGDLGRIIIHGAGWGHGVGLCQIGAAAMCSKGFSAEDVVGHYFRGAQVKALY